MPGFARHGTSLLKPRKLTVTISHNRLWLRRFSAPFVQLGSWVSTGVERLLHSIARETTELRAESVSRALPPPTPLDRARYGSVAFILIGSIMAGFVAYLVMASQVTFFREQSLLHEELRFELANSTSPVSQVGEDGELLPLGKPVALLEIDSIDLRVVVVEGTDARTLQSGPGHRRDTVMPGQEGASVIFGRQAAFGGPFANLDQLRERDRIVVTTGQGESVYRVVGVRYGQESLPERPPAEGTLTLVSATGIPFFAEDVMRVDAVLVGNAFDAGARAFGYVALPEEELAMASQFSSGAEVAVWSILLLACVVMVPLVRRQWGRWQAWAVGVPTVGLLAFLLFRELSTFLPNLT